MLNGPLWLFVLEHEVNCPPGSAKRGGSAHGVCLEVCIESQDDCVNSRVPAIEVREKALVLKELRNNLKEMIVSISESVSKSVHHVICMIIKI